MTSLPSSSQIGAAVDRAMPTTIATLGSLVRIPGIAWPSFDQSRLAESSERIAELVRGIGVFDEVHVRTAPIGDGPERGQPAVLARKQPRGGAPTVLLYAHHDVQPPGDEELWESPPFEPTVRDGRLYGRGAADDKAGVMAHIAAISALHETRPDGFDLGIALFIEGEEEFGSRSFASFLRENAETLAADVIVVADSGNWDTRTPALTVSLRGNVTFTLRIRTLSHASHSGMYGGAVPDATLAAIRLLDSFWDESGSVAIEGLISLDAPTPDYDEEQLRTDAGLLAGVTPIGRGPVLARIWNQPAVTVTGMDITPVASASNTLAAETAVVVSVRIAPGQPAADAFAAIERHIHEHVPFGAQVTIEQADFGNGFLVDTSGWAVGAAREALHEGFGVEPVDLGVGGSIPFIAELVEQFPGAQILVTGVEDPDSRAHSPNESLDLAMFASAVRSEALLLESLEERRDIS